MKVIACFAMSLDGKIAASDRMLASAGSAGKPKIRIGSEEDLAHLKRVRDLADASLFGASTFRAFGKVRWGSHPERPLQHILLTQSWNLPWDAPYFSSLVAGEEKGFPTTRPLIVVSSISMPEKKVPQSIQPFIQEITYPEGLPQEDQPAWLCKTLEQQGIQTLLVEGGGDVMAQWLEAQLVEELYLTICPKIVGGIATPTWVDGLGLPGFVHAKTISMRVIEEEIYLHLKLHYCC